MNCIKHHYNILVIYLIFKYYKYSLSSSHTYNANFAGEKCNCKIRYVKKTSSYHIARCFYGFYSVDSGKTNICIPQKLNSTQQTKKY